MLISTQYNGSCKSPVSQLFNAMTIIVKENALLCKVKFHHKLHEKAGKFHEGAGEDLYSAVVAVFTLFNTSMFMFEKTDISNNCSGFAFTLLPDTVSEPQNFYFI